MAKVASQQGMDNDKKQNWCIGIIVYEYYSKNA